MTVLPHPMLSICLSTGCLLVTHSQQQKLSYGKSLTSKCSQYMYASTFAIALLDPVGVLLFPFDVVVRLSLSVNWMRTGCKQSPYLLYWLDWYWNM